jgi:hypothetical protein
LNRNRSRHNWVGKREAITTVVEKIKSEMIQNLEVEEEESDYEDLLMAKIDENTLRKVFEGLVHGQRRS